MFDRLTARVALSGLLLLALLPGLPASVHAQQAQALVENVDYLRIDGGKPLRPLDAKTKVEVIEVFAYWCGHCSDMQPAVTTWKAKLPRDVRFNYLPAAFNANDSFARGYFAAEALGLGQRHHDALFRAIHAEQVLPRNATDAELGAWFAARGVDAAKFQAAMDSKAVAARMQQARAFAVRSSIDGTPAFILNGQYRILGKSRADQFRILDQLIAQLRAR